MGIWIWGGILGLAACSIYLIWLGTPRTRKVVIDLSGLGDDEREEKMGQFERMYEEKRGQAVRIYEEKRGQAERIYDELELRLASAFNEGYGDFKNGRASRFTPDEGAPTAETGESLSEFTLERVHRLRVGSYRIGYGMAKAGKPNQAEQWLEADKRIRGDFFALVEEAK